MRLGQTTINGCMAPAWARATCVAANFLATARSAIRDDAAAAATGDGCPGPLPLYDNDDDPNHNPDFEHGEVPQWALDQWERETRERQEGVASSATGGGASAATGDGAATGGGNGGTTWNTEDLGNLPPASRDARLARAYDDTLEWPGWARERVPWWFR